MTDPTADPTADPTDTGIADDLGGPSQAPADSPAEHGDREVPLAEVLPGAEPLSIAGGPVGALVIHGFTGNPQSMRGLAEAFGGAGFTVEMPRLPGHGTSLDDMLTTSWDDWSACADEAYRDLASRCEKVVVAGLSMGGSLSLWLATEHPEVAGLVLINAACPPPGAMDIEIEGLRALVDAGVLLVDSIGGDIADPDGHEMAYGQTPVAGLLSLMRAGTELGGRIGTIECPVLVMNSPEDHVVSPTHSDHIAATVGGEVERLTLERSYHVATLDYDKGLIEERAVEFARRVTSD
ncbi:MAG: alpha/beta fold hydrolase [Acidimicrobiia bacterium]|nr:alpha/beta fold hydrolase [Acidimicrobiia bacterium]